MQRTMRVAAATVVATALAIFPVVLDQCAASCEARHDGIANPPACHHMPGAAARLGHMPIPYAHDHNGTMVTCAIRVTMVAQPFSSMVTAVIPPGRAAGVAFEQYRMVHAPPGARSAIDTRLVHLRI